jgi:phospholipid/cholesterol/gamma-HCH transport system substrate-binding protein
MPDRKDVRAGIFVVAALAILAAGTIWIAGTSPFSGARASYQILMKGSSGVRRGDRVRMAGIQAGRIQKVELRTGEEWPVRFHVSVDPGVVVVEGSTGRISTDGLLGAPYLEIVSGPAGAPPLPQGSEILGIEGGDIVQTLQGLGKTTERLPVLIDGVVELVTQLNEGIEPLLTGIEALLSEESVDSITGAMNSLSETLDEVGPRLPGLIDRLETLAQTMESSVGEVPGLASETRLLIEDLRQALGPDGNRLAEVLGAAESTFEAAQGALDSVQGSTPELQTALRDLAAAAANLKSLSQTLKERPSTLLRSPRLPERQPAPASGPPDEGDRP